ncbi:MAG: uracil-DNA glycosylase [Chloroflexota bacterium]
MTAPDVVAELRAVAAEVQTCTRCSLQENAHRGVPGEGPSNADIMFVGEGPGFNEDKQGRPFVGAAGKFLDELLAIAGLTRPDVFITNVVKHRPPDNRNPLPDELAACWPYLERQIRLIDPRLIVTLGRYSLGTFFPGDLISKVHGQVRRHDGRYFFNMYHPAAALHQQALRETLIADMKRLAAFLGGPFIAEESSPESTTPHGVTSPEQLELF